MRQHLVPMKYKKICNYLGQFSIMNETLANGHGERSRTIKRVHLSYGFDKLTMSICYTFLRGPK